MLSTLLAALCPCSCTSPTPPPPPNTTTTTTYNHHHPNSIQYQTPLEPTLTLPAYTPHPNTETLNEKTLALHLRDPPISSSSYNNNNSFPLDEKHPYTTTSTTTPTSSTLPDGISTSNNATADDASSQISFPSTTHSYGNTSTATRETPPPPYSPTWRGHAEGEVEGV
ncbi:hypothetical protein AtubIFM57143_010991 [Aspergillus tubingensis]|nr:hypothetical protein AtubIFM57143_010991 [Aspergillus tubingensis]